MSGNPLRTIKTHTSTSLTAGNVPLHTLREGVIWFRISFMIELSGNSISPRGDRFKSSSSSAMPAACSRCSQPTPAHQPSLRLAPGHPILQVTKIRSRLDVLVKMWSLLNFSLGRPSGRICIQIAHCKAYAPTSPTRPPLSRC